MHSTTDCWHWVQTIQAGGWTFVEGTKLILENLFGFQGHAKHKCMHILLLYIILLYNDVKYHKRKARGISSMITKLVSMVQKHTNKMLPKHYYCPNNTRYYNDECSIHVYLYTSTDQPSINRFRNPESRSFLPGAGTDTSPEPLYLII